MTLIITNFFCKNPIFTRKAYIPMKHFHTRTSIILLLFMFGIQASGQITFSDATSSLVFQTVRSGAPIAISDMNADGLDDIVRLDNTRILRIEYQRPEGGFTGFTFGDLVGQGQEWSMCIADVDENGYNDIMAGGGYNQIKLLMANDTGTNYSQDTLPWVPSFFFPGIWLQASNFVDINNDGAIDYFGCHDQGLSAPYRGDNTGTFVWDTSLINPQSTVPSNNSGNYGSVWTDYDSDGDIDLYISKCKVGVTDPWDGQRLNLLFENDGNNNYSDVAEAVGLLPLGQSWATDFGDLDNDGDLDALVLNHDTVSILYMNQAELDTNYFVNVNDSAGITTALENIAGGIQVMMADFDNDGLLDIFVSDLNSTGGHKLFWNQGGMQFVNNTSIFPPGMLRIHTAALGDLNRDGFIDMIAGHGSGYNNPGSAPKYDDLLINNGNANHYLWLTLKGNSTHINGIGARVIAINALGRQTREVTGGESYGIAHSFNVHFGLGSTEVVDSLLVHWPSGVNDTFLNVSADQFLTIVEGSGPCDSNNPKVVVVTSAEDSGEHTLRGRLDAACPCDTILIDSSLDGDTIFLQSKLSIGRDLVIKGNGASQTVIVSGSTRGINIATGIEALFENLQWVDQTAGPSSQFIINCGTLTLNDCIIQSPSGEPFAPNVGRYIIGSGETRVR